MFREAYKKAYDQKLPAYDVVKRIEEKLQERQNAEKYIDMLRAAVTVCLTIFIMVWVLGLTAVPAMAKSVPAVYRVIERYAPALAEYILPEELSSSKAGVRMQVEAIQVDHKEAEIVVSFTDEEGYDYIHGPVDLYDSYRLNSFSGVSNVGGCSFLEYAEETDKAYYRIQATTFDTFDSERMQFSVRMLLTECRNEEKEISLDSIDFEPELKGVTLTGYGGTGNQEQIAECFGVSDDFSYRHAAQVLDTGQPDSSLSNQLTITGIAYKDGILRVQSCRGDLTESDRYMMPYIENERGEERHDDFGLGWHEKIDGVSVCFEERWFLIEEEELKNIRLFGEFCIREGCLNGDWEVLFKVE